MSLVNKSHLFSQRTMVLMDFKTPIMHKESQNHEIDLNGLIVKNPDLLCRYLEDVQLAYLSFFSPTMVPRTFFHVT